MRGRRPARQGPVAGIAAVAARSVGFLAKLVAEAIEEADRGQIEAVRATGASTAQVYLMAVLPQVMPVLIGTTVYRWDINVRESSVLGFVGAGGIGLLLYASINSFAWSQVIVVLFAILAVVLASEVVSAWVRARITWRISRPSSIAAARIGQRGPSARR